MKYIVYPIALRFKVDAYRHTLHTVQLFDRSDNRVSLVGNIKAQIGESKEECFKIITKELESYVTRFGENVKLSDFELLARAEEIENGAVWGPGTGTGMTYFLRDGVFAF